MENKAKSQTQGIARQRETETKNVLEQQNKKKSHIESKTKKRVFYHSSIKSKTESNSQKQLMSTKHEICRTTIVNQEVKETGVSCIKQNNTGSIRDELNPIATSSSPEDTLNLNNATEMPEQAETKSCNEFTPITRESIRYVQNIMKRFSSESRVVFVMFDACFAKSDLTFSIVRSKLEPVIGTIDYDCVLLKSNLTKLMPNPSKAYAREIKSVNQAYIICPKGMTEDELIQNASGKNILYGIMTFSCISNSLEKETFFINKEALLTVPLKRASVQNTEQEPARKVSSIVSSIPKENLRESLTSNSRVKTVTKPPKKVSKQKVTTSSSAKDAKIDPEAFYSLLLEKVENDTGKSDFVSKILPELTAFGNTAVCVSGLPGKLSMSTLNITLGCHTLKQEQVIAINRQQNGTDVTEVHIVIQSDKPELNQIVKCHNQELFDKARLFVKRITLKQLEAYLIENSTKIFRLKDEPLAPLKVIGYSNKN